MIIHDIHKAKEILDNNGVIGFPTETVYGLAGNGFSEEAIKTIFATKKRPFNNPLILHLKGKEEVESVARDIPDQARLLLEHFSPGPLTLLLNKKQVVPDIVTAGKPTVAIRIPEHPIALELLQLLDYPLAAPSANPFGCISPTTAQHVDDYFGEQLPAVLEGGPCRKGLESTIVGFKDGATIVYRLGTISIEEIRAIVGDVKLLNKDDVAPQAPGMLSRHYSPRTKLITSRDLHKTIFSQLPQKIGVVTMDADFNHQGINKLEILSQANDLEEAASNLYAALHRLDKEDLDLIIAEEFPEQGIGAALNDRLMRASKH
jgi:L-threonylcarbamoyladenylate synthase